MHRLGPAQSERRRLLAPQVIPCFGVHPWFAHTHALTPGTTLTDITERIGEGQLRLASTSPSPPPSSESVAAPSQPPPGADRTPQEARRGIYLERCSLRSGSRSKSPVPPRPGVEPVSVRPLASSSSADDPRQGVYKDEPLPPPAPSSTSSSSGSGLSTLWLARLRELLVRHPGAWVGEFGLDRAALIRGSKVSPGHKAGSVKHNHLHRHARDQTPGSTRSSQSLYDQLQCIFLLL